MHKSIKSYAQYLKDLHKEISKKIQMSNESYKHMADSHRRAKEFQVGDFVMIRLKPEQFALGTMKKLHAHAAGPF